MLLATAPGLFLVCTEALSEMSNPPFGSAFTSVDVQLLIGWFIGGKDLLFLYAAGQFQDTQCIPDRLV